MYYGDWTMDDAITAVLWAKSDGRKVVVLDMEHSSYTNEVEICTGLRKLGYEATNETEQIRVVLKE